MNDDLETTSDTAIQTNSDRKVSKDSQLNGNQLGIKMLNVLERMGDDMETLADTMTNMFRKQDEMSANTMQLLQQQSRTIEDVNNTFMQNRKTINSDLRSTGTSTSGYTDDDFLGNYPCPKYGLYDVNDEHLDHNLCEDKPVDSFLIGQGNSPRPYSLNQDRRSSLDSQLGRGNSSRPPPPKQDIKQTSDLQLGRGNSPRPTPFNPDRNPTSDLQLGRGNSPRPHPFNQDNWECGRENSPRSTVISNTPLSSTPRETTTHPHFRPLLSTIHRWESSSTPMSTSIIHESTRNIQPSFSSENAAIHSSNNTQQIRQKVSKNDVPHQNLPTFDGKDDYKGFIIPFNRAARQHNEKNDEFAEKVRRLVSRAFPTSSIELQEELAAEHCLKGHKNPKIAYEALNRQPKTVSSALDIVVQIQHNYHATLGRDVHYNTKQRARRVTRKDEEENSNDQYEGMESVRQLVHSFRKPDNQTLQNEIKALRDIVEKNMLNDSKLATLTAQSTGCYFCGDKSHFKRDCPKRSRCPSPKRRQNTGADCERRSVYQIGRGKIYSFQFKSMAIRSML
ncbi:Hypothetical predicted protein [Mytilus galloprovincialis]|uniref:CCHC-type domain-containing protein n=1 Tax=Mytilus galloprovincialis TaxID=29158 RepID=A0A8B6BVV1_MYTGA|nr:Hypothetical predicted protein [Mytilus galloprovincialis]